MTLADYTRAVLAAVLVVFILAAFAVIVSGLWANSTPKDDGESKS